MISDYQSALCKFIWHIHLPIKDIREDSQYQTIFLSIASLSKYLPFRSERNMLLDVSSQDDIIVCNVNSNPAQWEQNPSNMRQSLPYLWASWVLRVCDRGFEINRWSGLGSNRGENDVCAWRLNQTTFIWSFYHLPFVSFSFVSALWIQLGYI